MNTIHFNESGFDFPGLVAKVHSEAQPTVVEIETGQSVVVMPLSEFHAWQETAYLLGSEVNSAHLRKSLAQAKANQTVQRDLDES